MDDRRGPPAARVRPGGSHREAGWLRQQGADRSRLLVPGWCSDRSGWPSAPSRADGRIRLGCRGPCGGPVEGTHMTDPDLSDLRRRSANGDRDAGDQLIEVAAERGDLDELRRLADGGYTDAVDQLIELAG